MSLDPRQEALAANEEVAVSENDRTEYLKVALRTFAAVFVFGVSRPVA